MKKKKFVPFRKSKKKRGAITIHTHFIDRVAIINGFISGVALYPQVFKVLSSHDFTSVSVTSFVVIFINNIVWGLYAFHRGLISLLVASLLNLLAAGVLLLVLSIST